MKLAPAFVPTGAGLSLGTPFRRVRAALRPPGRTYLIVKRGLDIVLALTGLMAFALVIAVAVVAIRLDSQGPAFYRQKRMGKNGKLFALLKLRGMHIDARERFPSLYDYALDRNADFCFHQSDDPRVTRVGRWLRARSVDELPNLWNVLKGDMSLVGPRPEIPELAHLYGADLDRFLSIQPGLTSPAKAVGRDALTFTETLDQDLEYIQRRSLLLDLRTLVRTLVSVIRRTNVR